MRRTQLMILGAIVGVAAVALVLWLGIRWW
jgi:hypothetical protein